MLVQTENGKYLQNSGSIMKKTSGHLIDKPFAPLPTCHRRVALMAVVWPYLSESNGR